MALTSEAVAARCRDDGEFRLTARYWDGSLAIDLGTETLAFSLSGGQISSSPANGEAAVRIAAPAGVWQKVLAAVPPPFFNDIMPARAFGLTVEGDDEMFCQYYPAIRRMIDLMREGSN